jgi:hypothetical protein
MDVEVVLHGDRWRRSTWRRSRPKGNGGEVVVQGLVVPLEGWVRTTVVERSSWGWW